MKYLWIASWKSRLFTSRAADTEKKLKCPEHGHFLLELPAVKYHACVWQISLYGIKIRCYAIELAGVGGPRHKKYFSDNSQPDPAPELSLIILFHCQKAALTPKLRKHLVTDLQVTPIQADLFVCMNILFAKTTFNYF